MQEFREHDIEWDDEKVSRIWDFYSKTYPYNQIYFTKNVGKDILKRTEKIIGSLNDKVVLDFGCGPAFFIEHMNELKIKPKKYIGLDFSKDSVSRIENKKDISFKKEGLFVQTLPSNIKDNSIDVCFLIEVIEHLNDDYLDSTLKEIYRVLKPNGKLIITTPNNEDLDFSKNFCPDCGCIYHKYQHVRIWDPISLNKKLLKYKFSKNTIIETNFITTTSILKDLFIKTRGIVKKKNINLFGIFNKL